MELVSSCVQSVELSIGYLLRTVAGFSQPHAISSVGLTNRTTCYHSESTFRNLADSAPGFAARLQRLRKALAENLQTA